MYKWSVAVIVISNIKYIEVDIDIYIVSYPDNYPRKKTYPSVQWKDIKNYHQVKKKVPGAFEHKLRTQKSDNGQKNIS